ncbi:unsaturated rhamnogalacturonyl hydrolase YesR [Ruminiclostridium hungatei]|uniref:Unsaturated rhamnogalacturonyl hydrolase YesR n=1 Tax=Ruminiclostridium hungatei TaxID=48256 RepID=A0A1V4SIE3_RUMHU|nr:glycoside hydrolase family 88 protein [Ruminiclostridium hungatei]OPX43659.1 unsaturated rhamnogalacturonyl hydrolase YesR [Ruminiclostridium hungatei]
MHENELLGKVKTAVLTMQRWPWEQGVVAQAFYELGDIELALLMAREAVTNQYKDGRLAMKYERIPATDSAANGEIVLRAAQITGEEKFKAGAQKMLDYLLYRAPRSKDGIIYHNENDGKFWVDSVYMAPPFLAAAGYHKEAVRQVEGYRRYLFDTNKKLYKHQWDDYSGSFARGLHWGVGNGWVAAGIVRILRELPRELTGELESLKAYLREVIDGCLSYQREDGLFHDIVDDPETFVDSNLAQMLSYAIYRAVTGGWLPEEYIPVAHKMRKAAYERVDENGLIQGSCGVPDFNAPATAPEVQAFYILMEAAYYDYKGQRDKNAST